MRKLSALVAALLLAGRAAAQDASAADSAAADSVAAARDTALPPVQVPAGYTQAAPSLPHDHWAVRAARRAEALGLAPGFFPAQGAVPLDAVGRALHGAAARAVTERPGLAATADAWSRRFREEFRRFEGVGARWSGAAGGGGSAETGRLVPGSRIFAERTSPRALPDREEGAAHGLLAGAAGPVFARAEVHAGSSGAGVPRWEAGARWGHVSLSAGDEAIAYGPARAGGIVLSGAAPLTRVQLETARPLQFVGILRVLGRATFHTAVSRMDEERHPGEPWFFSARVGVQPHPRFTVGVSRAAIFGGDSVDVPTTPRNVSRMLVGMLTGVFENQVVAMDFRWRLPTERALPVTAYLEWGAEDAAGAWRDVPARTVGAWIPALPALPQLALGAEYTRFALFCCGNPPWYSHAGQVGGWVHEQRPLGHPLGGEGWEALGYAQGELLDARLRIEGRAFLRERGDRGLATPQRAANLYAPDRAGRSVGASLDASYRFGSRLEGRAQLFRDAGRGWREQRATAGVAYIF